MILAIAALLIALMVLLALSYITAPYDPYDSETPRLPGHGNYRSYTPGVVVRAGQLTRALEAREQARRVCGTGERVKVRS